MENSIANFNLITGIGTLIVQIFSLILLIGLITKDKSLFFEFFSKKALFFVFLISFGSTAVSLIYSNVIGFSPCNLCWIQRIFMYSTAIISIVALIKKYETEIWTYIKTLSFIGGIVALYHSLTRFIGTELIPCSANGPSCLQDLFKVFGYIDIPVMSLTAFIFIILAILNKKRFNS